MPHCHCLLEACKHANHIRSTERKSCPGCRPSEDYLQHAAQAQKCNGMRHYDKLNDIQLQEGRDGSRHSKRSRWAKATCAPSKPTKPNISGKQQMGVSQNYGHSHQGTHNKACNVWFPLYRETARWSPAYLHHASRRDPSHIRKTSSRAWQSLLHSPRSLKLSAADPPV